MNTIEKSILDFEKKGIHLFAENGKLRYKASKELMTPDVMAELKQHKAEILEFLEKQHEQSSFIIDRTNRYEPFPLTDVQSAYLLGRNNLFEYGGVACHVYLSIRYKELEPAKVRSIWNKLIAKYDMLHAIIDESGFQQVLKEIPQLEVPEWDLVQNPEKQKEYETFVSEMSTRTYAIGKWPMFGIAVSKHQDCAILHFSIEFLIADWTSIWKLVSEFEAAYFDGIEISGEEEISFRDYLVAEKKVKMSAQYEKEKKYWMDRISTLPEAPDLPKLPLSEDHKKFSRKFLRIAAKDWNIIKERAKRYGITPTVPILASYADVLAKWSTNKRFCVNMTVLNRLPLHEKVMDIVGDFTSLSLLEIDSHSSNSFLARAKKINAQLFADLDNRLFSGVEVMREISRQSKKTGLSMPIVYTSAIGLADSGAPLRGDFVGGISQTPQTFIDCQVMDGSFGLQANWDYREGVFPEGILESMFESFENRLRTLADESSNWENIADIALPARDLEERKTANDTQKDWNERLLQDDFIQSVKRTPQKIAIDDGHIKFSFKELDARAKVLANELISCGVKPQDCVPVLMEKSAWQVVSVLGILYAGAIYVPIAAAKAMGRAEKIVKKMQAKIAVGISTDKPLLESELKTIQVDTLSNATSFDENKFPKRSPNDIAYIIYTSGSTGEPKGVVITHKGAMNTIDDMNDRFGITAEDNVLGLSQLNFDLSVYDLFGILAHGGTLIYPASEDYMNPEAWEKELHKHHITVWNTVPALMKMLLNYVESKPQAKPLPLREIFLSGDWIPLDMPEKIRNAAPGADVICLGGATEASIWSNYHRYNPNDGLKILPYGRPLANQTMHILDEQLRPCPTMVAGQIALGGDGVALGYYGDKERTDAQFVNLPDTNEHVYLTGDLGRYLPGGEIEFLGRKDNQVKIRGHRIELGEIENVFKDHPLIRDAAAIVNSEKSEINIMLQAGMLNAEQKQEQELKLHNIFKSMESETGEILNRLDWSRLKTANKKMEYASSYSILKALQDLGILKENIPYSLNTIEDAVPERYRWHTNEWLRILQDNGLLAVSGNQYKSSTSTTPVKLAELWNDVQAHWDEQIGNKFFLDALRLYGEHFTKFLDGSEDPTLVLAKLNQETNDEKKESFENWTKFVQSWTAGKNLAECIKAYLKKITKTKSKNYTWKILELGAGAGQLTRQILPFLREIGCNFEYLFTDYQPKFFPAAKEIFADYPNISFKRIDINEDFQEQGIEARSIDFVICAEVLDNSTDLRKTLENIGRIMLPQGFAFIMEPYGETAWLSISQTQMMDSPTDSLRKNCTFLPAEKWNELLNEIDQLDSCITYPQNKEQGKLLSVNLFVKQFKYNEAIIEPEELKSYMDKFLLNYMHPSHIEFVDKLPLSANGKIDRKAIRAFFDDKKSKEAMQKAGNASFKDALEEKIFEVWAKALQNKEIGPESNFYDYGADSLMMAQTATTIRNEIAPSSAFDALLKQMLDFPTIRETADFIAKTQQTKTEENTPEDNSLLRVLHYGKPKDGKLRVVLPAIFWNPEKFKNLILLLEKQDEGEIITFAMNDEETFEKLHPAEVGSKLAEKFIEPILQSGAKEVQIITYCYISPVGLEMAERLLDAGIKVSDLSIIDGSRLGFKAETSLIRKVFFAQLLFVDFGEWGLDAEEFIVLLKEKIENAKVPVLTDNDIIAIADKMKTGDKIKELLKIDGIELLKLYQKYSKGFGNSADIPMLERLYKLYNQSMNVMLNYTPVPYYGDIVYLKAHNDEGFFRYFDIMYHEWDELCLGEIDIQSIPGNHFSCLQEPKLVQIVADKLSTKSRKSN